MPFDGTLDLAPAPAPDLTKPSLEALAYILEHPNLWPPGWHWDFTTVHSRVHPCHTAGCAAGIAITMWGPKPAQEALNFRMHGNLLAASKATHAIFMRGAKEEALNCGPAVTPAMVAGRIRQHLAGQLITFEGGIDV